jgi:hypothetical protein
LNFLLLLLVQLAAGLFFIFFRNAAMARLSAAFFCRKCMCFAKAAGDPVAKFQSALFRVSAI